MTRRVDALRAGAVAVVWLGAAPAQAERPALADEATFAPADGAFRVHYATAGIDAAPTADADGDRVPDFVAEVATTAELALARFVELGFRRPLPDDALGGDGRIDIYLRDLRAADGNAGVDQCDAAGHCIGHVSVENDFAGYGYASQTEAIRSVVPHEIFHLVQHAYASSQPSPWTEGSAVWAVEYLFGDGCSDFERFLPAFVTRSFRPFERAFGGFGDSYPYGAALWTLYLEQRFGVATVVAAWEASEHAVFLDAVDEALRPAGSTTDDAWVEFSRWNLFTGSRAAGGDYANASTWPEVPREPAIRQAGTIYVEGLSARYVPITAARRARLAVTATGGITVAGWLVVDTGRLADGIELTPADGALTTTIAPGAYTLVVTGLSRGTLTTAVDVALTDAPVVEPPVVEPPVGGGAGGCASTPAPPSALGLLVTALGLVRRGRSRRRALEPRLG